ncbi:MAG: YggT family protein [Oscillospiraceae bacterium]|nr:YggT family protein [Oscillospiraceae bacterium]
MFGQVIVGVLWFLQLVQWVLLIYCVLSWFMPPQGRLMQMLTRVTNPILHPIRTLLTRVTHSYQSGMFAPIVAYFLISLLGDILARLGGWLQF